MIRQKSTYNVVCDKCGVELPTNAESIRLAIDEARSLGWKHTITLTVNRDYCPHCANEKPEKKEYYGG